MLKIVGVIMVITACTGMGVYEGRELTKHENVMKQIRQMLLLLKGEIQYGNSSLFDIFAKISLKIEGETGFFLKELLQEIRKNDRYMFYDIFEACAERKMITKRMSLEEKEDFLSFGKQLGGSDRKTQIAQMEIYMKELEYDIEKLHMEVQEKKKLYRNMGVLCGFFLVIILW